MRYRIEITGDSPILMHSAAGLDTSSAISREISEIAAKRGLNRTITDELRLKQLECQRSLWLENGEPTVPHSAVRAVIEAAARKLKQGPSVREGLIVESTSFEFDREKYGDTLDDWGKKCQHSVPVVVQRSRIIRTRAKFDTPWKVSAVIYGDDALIDRDKLTTWLDIAGQRIGLGDWRPACSGAFGRFSVHSVVELPEG